VAFADVAAQDGIGWAWLLDVSFDNFATVSYRWSTFSCLVGSNQYEARIPQKGLSRLARAFGDENTIRAGDITVSLDNTDYGADWLVDRSTVASQVFRARFKLTLLVYPPGQFSSYQTKVCGTFKALTFPSRDRERVTLQLSDDTMGFFADALSSPTIREWIEDAGSNINTNPLFESFGPTPAPNSDWDTPMPLAFGQGRLICFPAALDLSSDYVPPGEATEGMLNSPMTGFRAIMVCATTSTADVIPTDLRQLWGVFGEDTMMGSSKWADGAGTTISIPKTYTTPHDTPSDIGPRDYTFTIWEPQKTQTLTKDGASWKLLWVKFNVDAYKLWFQASRKISVGGTQTDGSTTAVAYLVPQAPGSVLQSRAKMFGAFSHFQVTGSGFSGRTNTSVAGQTGIDVIRDLISYYSHGSASDVDTTRFDAARQMCPVGVSGILMPQRPVTTRFRYSPQAPPANALTNGHLQQALQDICQSADLDLAMTWDGKIAVFSSYFSFANLTTTRVVIDETRGNNVIERIPSKGQRWSPYNRVYVVDPSGVPHGPFDNPDASVDWGVVLERTLHGKWSYPFAPSEALYTQNVWFSQRRIESLVRPVIQFVTDRDGLQLDLGDLFDFTWSRGGGTSGPYNASVFRVESITVDPDTLAVGIEAVWVDDVRSVYPYLLDLEALTVRVASSAGRTVNVMDGDTEHTFSTGDLTTDGVVEGDVLVLLDATQAQNVFTRFRALRITAVLDAVTIETSGDPLPCDFSSPGGANVATWEIRKGALTYPTSSSDPTNYPSDGTMYGKASDDDDRYSDTGDANKLI